MPRLESAIKEALRLHPPLILLLRAAKQEFCVEGYRISAGKLVAASPAVSNRIPEDFPDPDSFVPAAVPRAASRGQGEPVVVDTVRGGPSPLRRRSVRDDAAEGDLLGAASRMGVRSGARPRRVPQRPLEDGRAARATVPCPLPEGRRQLAMSAADEQCR